MKDQGSTIAAAEPGPADRVARAARVMAPGRVEMVELPLPRPGAGEVLVRIEGCGVCASNLEPWSGPEWQDFPMEPGLMGHEAWGTIEALGEGVGDLHEGQRIAWLGNHGYASHEIVAADTVLPLPKALDGRPVPAEPLGCAMNIFRRSGIAPGQTVAIVGIGFLGAILTRLATDAGARVIALSRRPYSLDVARRMGAVETLALDDHYALIAKVSELTDGRFCDVVIEAVGKAWPLDLAAELTRERGRLVIAGYHQDGPRQVNMQMWNWKGIDIVSAHERDPEVQRRGMIEGIAAAAGGRLDLDALLTHRYPLARLGDALDATRDKPQGFVKAWVSPQEDGQ